MTRMIRVELLKLRTIRLGYGLLAAAAGFSAVFSLLLSAKAGRAIAPISTAAGLASVTTDTGFALLLAAVLGITVSAGEFRHGTAATTYLSFPRRGRVLAAKAIAAAAAGAILGLAGGFTTTTVGLLLAAVHHDRLALGTGTLAGHIAGAGAGAALLAAAGAGIGSLIRGQLGAVTGVFAWAAAAEPVIGGLFPGARPYLPYTAATTLSGTKLTAAFFGIGRLPAGPEPLPFAAAAALITAFAVLAAAAAARTTVRRDIT